MHRLFVLSLYVLPAFTALLTQQGNLGSSLRGLCGTAAPSELLRAEHKRLSSVDAQRVKGDNGSGEILSPIEIDTWFHIVSTTDQVDLVTDDMIVSQFSFLQQAYANTSISYKLVGVDRSINDTWARNGDDLGMKRILRRGTYRTLNVYFQTDLQVSPGSSISARDDDNSIGTFSVPPQFASNLLGFCTLPNPRINASSPLADYIEDGCNILAATMPGGSIPHYNLGGTTIHEVGHWNGLLHTFQGETCAPDGEGDYIPDTPSQSIPTDGCPAAKDSCPESPGMDAIHNFMDYSSDDCYQSFTRDQATRMKNMWSLMRDGK